MKTYNQFNKSKHTLHLPPQLLVAANQEGGVLIATTTGYYKMEKVEFKNGEEYKEIVVDEANLD